MAVTILKEEQIPVTHNIVVGLGEVVARDDKDPLTYSLPGGRETTCYDEAVEWATILDKIIKSNLPNSGRSILNMT